MVFCETCGQENNEAASFCRFCGAAMGTLEYRPSNQSTYSNRNESIGFGSRNTSEHLVLHCSLCSGQDFAKDTGRLDSKWGFTSFKVMILSCKKCGHVELFNKGRSIFDFD